MRRKDREITDREEIVPVLDEARVMRLALITSDFPYIVPLNYGYEWNDTLILYFHCAKEGRKCTLIASNNKVGFEIDTGHSLVTGERDCDWGYNYKSIIGTGMVEELEGDDKIHGLKCLMVHHGKKDGHSFIPKMLEVTRVYKVVAVSVSAKIKK